MKVNRLSWQLARTSAWRDQPCLLAGSDGDMLLDIQVELGGQVYGFQGTFPKEVPYLEAKRHAMHALSRSIVKHLENFL